MNRFDRKRLKPFAAKMMTGEISDFSSIGDTDPKDLTAVLILLSEMRGSQESVVGMAEQTLSHFKGLAGFTKNRDLERKKQASKTMLAEAKASVARLDVAIKEFENEIQKRMKKPQ